MQAVSVNDINAATFTDVVNTGQIKDVIGTGCVILWDRVVGNGKQQGVDEGTLNCLLGYIRRKNVPVDNAMEDLDIPLASRQRYMVSLNKMLGFGV